MALKIKPTEGRKRKLGKKGTINARCLHTETVIGFLGNKYERTYHATKGWRVRRVYE